MFDIFRQNPEGHPLWVEVQVSLREAHKRLAELSFAAPGRYAIFDSREGRFVVPFVLDARQFSCLDAIESTQQISIDQAATLKKGAVA